MNVEAIIFDMDGLLVDSEPRWEEARQRLAASVHMPWTHRDHLSVVGVSTDDWADYLIKRLQLGLTRVQVQEEIIRQMVEIYRKQIPFKPYAVEAVKWAAQNFPTALASGSPYQLIDMVVNSPELKGCFDVVVSSDEIGVGKPDPTIYLETARRLKVPAENCMCLEDSANGVLAGRRANMVVINVPDRDLSLTPEQAANADLVLDSLAGVNDSIFDRVKKRGL